MDQIPTTPEGDQLYKNAINNLYTKHMKNIEASIRTVAEKPQKLANVLAQVVLSSLKQAEKGQGQISIELAAEVGMRIFNALITDLVEDGVVEVSTEVYNLALGEIIGRYAHERPDITPEMVNQLFAELQAQQGGQAQAPAQAPAQPGMEQGLLA